MLHMASCEWLQETPSNSHGFERSTLLVRPHGLLPLDVKHPVIDAQATLPIFLQPETIQPQSRGVASLLFHVCVYVHPVPPPRKLDFEAVGLFYRRHQP